MIKDYIIKETLGKGSYGIVYKVEKKNTNNIYVIKQISLHGLSNKEKDEVNQEAEILRKINSDFVVKYYTSFKDKDKINIVMEYCDGGDLNDFIKEKKEIGKLLEEDLVWEIFIKITIGLSDIHKMKILHRDLKTLNIFLKKNMEIKIGDLGVAKILLKNSFAKTVIGTPYYLSPEICQEKPYNDKSDVWALGCILYELCTFNHPFDARSQGALILKILNNKPEPIDNYYSRDLNNLINLLLDKN
jgi:NIMA (never in mitosis gene a)-related kinase